MGSNDESNNDNNNNNNSPIREILIPKTAFGICSDEGSRRHFSDQYLIFRANEIQALLSGKFSFKIHEIHLY